MQPARKISSAESAVTTGKIPVLIYDGECALCRRAVEWIRARMDADAFEFLPCQSEDLPKRFSSIGKDACLKAMHLAVPDGMVLIGENALPEILRRLPRYKWASFFLGLPGVNAFSRVFYRWFAARRMHISRTAFPES